MDERRSTAEWQPPEGDDLALVERHALEDGITEFDLCRDVSFPGNPAPNALFNWNPERRALLCIKCPGTTLYADDEPAPAYLRALTHEPALQPFLAGRHTVEERMEMARSIQRGEISKGLLTLARRSERMRTRKPSPPDVAARRERCQRHFLAEYEKVGNVNRAILALVRLRNEDPERYREIVGSDRQFSHETFRDYWQAIPPAQRQEAKARYDTRMSERRRRLTP